MDSGLPFLFQLKPPDLATYSQFSESIILPKVLWFFNPFYGVWGAGLASPTKIMVLRLLAVGSLWKSCVKIMGFSRLRTLVIKAFGRTNLVLNKAVNNTLHCHFLLSLQAWFTQQFLFRGNVFFVEVQVVNLAFFNQQMRLENVSCWMFIKTQAGSTIELDPGGFWCPGSTPG